MCANSSLPFLLNDKTVTVSSGMRLVVANRKKRTMGQNEMRPDFAKKHSPSTRNKYECGFKYRSHQCYKNTV